ncbi:MAG: hypothetical protein ABIK81_02260 [candidate division WOR-3 bacterium]
MKRAMIMMVVGLFSVFAQYSIEWSSGNLGSYGYGSAWLDVDEDGLSELQIRKSDTLIFYNGDYSVKWRIAFPGFTYISPITPRDIDGDGLIVPVNTDADASKELVVIGYRYTNQYEGKIRVYDVNTRNLEWESQLLSGLLGSGNCEDLDGDGKAEIIINRIINSNYYVDVYAYAGQGTGDSYSKSFTTPIISNPINKTSLPEGIKEIYDLTGRSVDWQNPGIYFINYKGKVIKVIVE